MLPCKKGDTVYVDVRTFMYGKYNSHKFAEALVTSTTFSHRNYVRLRIFSPYVNQNRIFRYSLSAFGKTIFLTKEAAEQALKGEVQWSKQGKCPATPEQFEAIYNDDAEEKGGAFRE